MRYRGGKSGHGTLQILLGLMPAHENFVSLFCGGCAVEHAKTPAPAINAISDVDAGTIAALGGEGPHAWGHLGCADYRDAAAELSDVLHHPRTLCFLDPPYLAETRTRLFYRHELATREEHSELLAFVRGLGCMVMLCGYWSALYASALPDWRVVRYRSMTRGGPREECVWMNFPEPAAFHDPLYAARGFRERERVKRRSARWASRFAAMTAAERRVVWASLRSAMTTSASPNMASTAAALATRGDAAASPALTMGPSRQR